MKIKSFIIMLTGLVIAVSSCEVTDTVPLDSITDLNYWKKPDDLKLFVNGFYTYLAGAEVSVTTYSFDFLEPTSDNVVTSNEDVRLFNKMSIPASGGGWSTSDWTNIRNLNYALTHYQTITGNEAEINHYVGEVKFFRAYEYFKKVLIFGDVPWMGKDLTTNDVDLLYHPRDPMKLVVDSIIADLEFAAANMYAPTKVEKGRLHKFAALQMLARVCLYEGTYMKYRSITGWESYLTKAASTAERVMNEGGYAIIKGAALYMFSDYPLFYLQQFLQEDLTTNKECVLPRIFTDGILMNWLSGISVTTQSGPGASKDFIESFLCIDGKPIALSPLYLGDDSLEMEITNRDPRLRNMIDNKKIPYMIDGVKLVIQQVTPVAISECPTGYQRVKYHDPRTSQNIAGQGTCDFYIFRYAEVLLIFAEAKAELGTITQSDLDKSINLLRERLDEPGKFTMGRLSINPPADPLAIVNGAPRYGYSISPLLYEIRRERRVELAFEGFRWNDIVRWKAGKLIENPKTFVGIVVNSDVVARYKYVYKGLDQFAGRSLLTINDWDGSKDLLQVYKTTSRTWVDKLYLDPIPSNQLTLNTKLVQNPGW